MQAGSENYCKLFIREFAVELKLLSVNPFENYIFELNFNVVHGWMEANL